MNGFFKWGSDEMVNVALTSILIGNSERSRFIYPSTKVKGSNPFFSTSASM